MKPMFFNELHLGSDILKALMKLKFNKLTPIQVESIPLLLKGLDVMGQAQTGTGKTAAYGIPLVSKMDSSHSNVQGLVITPTRELTIQVSQRLKRYARYSAIKIVAIYGGDKISKQTSLIEKEVQIIVGTPGRLIDLIKKQLIDLRFVKVLVIDEADKMFDMGFKDDVTYIISKLPYVRQTSLWSATLNDEVTSYANRFMRRPRKILISKEEIAKAQIEQYFINVTNDTKFFTLIKLLRTHNIDQALIFCNTRKTTEELASKLQEVGIPVHAFHGLLSQTKRKELVVNFQRKKINYLVSTDIASRGLDIKGISHIINYEVPFDSEVYFHRIGRSGRMEEKGTSITLVTEEEESNFSRIKSMTNLQISILNTNS
jgi:ATP-dependent RNA helicase DeaD